MNRCHVNPTNTGHEPMHPPAKNIRSGVQETYTFMGYDPGAEGGPKVDLHICKHCWLVYGTEKPAPEVPDQA